MKSNPFTRYFSGTILLIIILQIIYYSTSFRKSPLETDPEFNKQYYLLEKYLSEYDSINKKGGWETIPSGDTLKAGIRSDRVIRLHERLIASNDLKLNSVSVMDSFSRSTEQAVKIFQQRHGLISDGIVEKHTLAALNISTGERIKQIKLNMNRWKEMPAVMDNYYIFINTADFRLEVVEADTVRLEMQVIVGRYYRKTPVIHSVVTGMVFNPYWYIPPGILKNDILPKVKKDSAFIKRMNIRVYESTGETKTKKEINPDDINWKEINTEKFPYQLVQSPGSKNPMGVVKFNIPNKYLVYLHDTPDKKLFERQKRTFSSGCIRISKAKELADYLLRNIPDEKYKNTDSIINSRKTINVDLPEPVKIYIEYFTCWVDDRGKLNFRDDIYGRDK